MFGWLKRRLRKEHRKLSCQIYLAGCDSEMRTLCAMYGDWDASDSYETAEEFGEYLIRALARNAVLSSEDVDAALRVNKDLRRLFDAYGRKNRGSFDSIYDPSRPFGWADYLAEHEDDMELIARQAEVKKMIEE